MQSYNKEQYIWESSEYPKISMFKLVLNADIELFISIDELQMLQQNITRRPFKN